MEQIRSITLVVSRGPSERRAHPRAFLGGKARDIPMCLDPELGADAAAGWHRADKSNALRDA